MPLEGKYYNTYINCEIDPDIRVLITVCCHTPNPSERQLQKDGFTSVEDWRNDGAGCDGHYESDVAYEISKIITEVLNQVKLTLQ